MSEGWAKNPNEVASPDENSGTWPLSEATNAANSPRILIVDDDAQSARGIARVLRRAGYDTVLALSGADAKALASAQHFDAIVTDLLMPGMNGLQLARAIREDAAGFPVVLVTGDADAGLWIGECEDDGLRCLAKPFYTSDLQQALQDMIARRPTRAARPTVPQTPQSKR